MTDSNQTLSLIFFSSSSSFYFSVMDVLGARASNYWAQNDVLANILPWNGKERYNEVLKAIYTFSNDVILRRRAYLMAKKSGDDNNDESDDQIVFVDSLLQGAVDGEPLENDAILDQVNTLTFNVSVLNCTTFIHSRQVQKK